MKMTMWNNQWNNNQFLTQSHGCGMPRIVIRLKAECPAQVKCI